MRFGTKHAQVLLFALAATAPVAALLTGEADPYGSPHPPFPEAAEYAMAEPGAFDALGDAILRRSPLSRAATVLRNGVAYHVLHHVDTAKVASGLDGWLFFRPELGGARCLDERRAAAAGRRLSAFADLARTVGVEPTFTYSPDKSAIYPEKLAVWAKRRYRCRLQNSATLREQLSAEAPEVIDHGATLLAEKAAHPERPLYFATDTHWTPYGGALAVRDLARRLVPEGTVLPAPRTLPTTVQRTTDLRTGMLVLDEREPVHPLDPAAEDELFARVPPVQDPTVIVHDSFYATLKEPLARLFPQHTLIHVDAPEPNAAALASARRLVVNTVERALVGRAFDGALSPWGPFYAAMLARNEARARSCEFSGPAPTPLALHDVTVRDGRYEASGPDPYVILPAVGSDAADEPCLRVGVSAREASEVPVALYLPRPTRRNASFATERVWIVTLAAGAEPRSFVLPGYVRGRGVRVDLEGDAPSSATLSVLELGWLRATQR